MLARQGEEEAMSSRTWTIWAVMASALVWAGPASTAIVTEVFTDRASFEARLAGVVVVDFDDIDTTGTDPAAFDADRYAATLGMIITGEGGQYASPSFFAAVSAPNLYAPGPINFETEGSNDTDVTFVTNGAPALVAGFGAVFVDADFPGLGPSSLSVFGAENQLLAAEMVTGPDGSQLFRGIVTVDDQTDEPIPAIRRAHLINGNEWPPRDVAEGVGLDDFIAGAGGVPVSGVPVGGKKLVLTGSSLKLLAKDAAISIGTGNGGVDDPTLHGGSLRIVTANGDGFDTTYDLPAPFWRTINKPGKNKGYKLKGADPIKTVVVKPGKLIKVAGKGALGHSLATSPDPVFAVLTFGTQTYCASFGGTVKFVAGKKFQGKKSQAPAACTP
jgi:hypothetical protein